VAERPTEVHHPSQKSLANVRGVRAELVRLYREGKAGLVEPILLGRLTTVLNVVQGMDTSTIADQRLSELEEKVAVLKPNGPRAKLRQPGPPVVSALFERRLAALERLVAEVECDEAEPRPDPDTLTEAECVDEFRRLNQRLCLTVPLPEPEPEHVEEWRAVWRPLWLAKVRERERERWPGWFGGDE
jgi:hypothetical protein